nr:uncharacterized protein LOC105482136 [Macaca nemestrina]
MNKTVSLSHGEAEFHRGCGRSRHHTRTRRGVSRLPGQRRQPQVGKAQARDTLGLRWGEGRSPQAPPRGRRSSGPRRDRTLLAGPVQGARDAGRLLPAQVLAPPLLHLVRPALPPHAPPPPLQHFSLRLRVLWEALGVPDCCAVCLVRQVSPLPLHVGLQLSRLPLVSPPEFSSVRASSLSAAQRSPSPPASSSSLRLAGRLVVTHFHLVDYQPRRLLRLLAGHLGSGLGRCPGPRPLDLGLFCIPFCRSSFASSNGA